MSKLASKPPRETKTAIQRIPRGRKAGVGIAAHESANRWQPHSVRAALSGLGKTGYSISGVHPAPPGGITNYCIASNPGRTQ